MLYFYHISRLIISPDIEFPHKSTVDARSMIPLLSRGSIRDVLVFVRIPIITMCGHATECLLLFVLSAQTTSANQLTFSNNSHYTIYHYYSLQIIIASQNNNNIIIFIIFQNSRVQPYCK